MTPFPLIRCNIETLVSTASTFRRPAKPNPLTPTAVKLVPMTVQSSSPVCCIDIKTRHKGSTRILFIHGRPNTRWTTSVARALVFNWPGWSNGKPLYTTLTSAPSRGVITCRFWLWLNRVQINRWSEHGHKNIHILNQASDGLQKRSPGAVNK